MGVPVLSPSQLSAYTSQLFTLFMVMTLAGDAESAWLGGAKVSGTAMAAVVAAASAKALFSCFRILNSCFLLSVVRMEKSLNMRPGERW
ncbi:hypothetical protein ACIGXA_39710 [Streptomyces fildesensis]|uniref:Uncharacterized protein n=1 Tax=Streptomyces fildesensis TaxID=375757 RepID=A0ABW8CJL3_9ACTN